MAEARIKVFILSDLHLVSDQTDHSRALVQFLEFLSDRRFGGWLVLAGDIFDAFVADHSVFQDRYRLVIEALKSLRESGCRVIYFEGNHDVHLKGLFEKKLKMEVYDGPKVFVLPDGFRVRVEHGDFINQDDHEYLKWRAAIRSRMVRRLAYALPGWIWAKIADELSRRSRVRSQKRQRADHHDLVGMIRSYAQSQYDQSKDFDLLVTGHMHVWDQFVFQVDGRRVCSLNLGWWGEPKDPEVPFVHLLENREIKKLSLESALGHV